MRLFGRLAALLTLVVLVLAPAAAGADEIGPGQPLRAPAPHASSGVSLLDVGRWVLIVLAFAVIAGALIVKRNAVRAALRNNEDQSSAS